jgi:MOSC domain-containing protein YiiM
MTLEHLFITPQHNFVGHHGLPPGTEPMVEMDTIECVAGRGVREDRYFDHKRDYKGQITFFSMEVYEDLMARLGVSDREPTVFRRNVMTRGVDLNTLIGKEFTWQGVRFSGSEECKPCYWMDTAFAQGALDALKGNGGLRARILSDGVLRCGPA